MERKQALTFEAEVKNGVLALPEDYRKEVQGRVSAQSGRNPRSIAGQTRGQKE